jgi:RNase H-like domain found in reverse transcriptase/Reverse transcriptase (RNA-dependent DNA polymerase)
MRIPYLIQRMCYNELEMPKYITTFDCTSGYWQTIVDREYRWLTGFICNDKLYQWTRTPFGMRNSGATFIRNVQIMLQSIRNFTVSFVDDLAVYSETWTDHLQHMERSLETIRTCGVTLKLCKCRFAKPEVKFVGQIIGSGRRRADPDKIAVVQRMRSPETKKQLRQALGFFSYFREYIDNYAARAKVLTDLTSKRVPSVLAAHWTELHEQAFNDLKQTLCVIADSSLSIFDLTKPCIITVDASSYAVAGILSQCDDNGNERPIAFASQKLNSTQQHWAVVEKEAYAVIWTLRKYFHWLFGAEVIVYSDHNPLSYLNECTPKSPKLMRWALALQQFNISFRFKAGKVNAAADWLSRMGPGGVQPTPE